MRTKRNNHLAIDRSRLGFTEAFHAIGTGATLCAIAVMMTPVAEGLLDQCCKNAPHWACEALVYTLVAIFCFGFLAITKVIARRSRAHLNGGKGVDQSAPSKSSRRAHGKRRQACALPAFQDRDCGGWYQLAFFNVLEEQRGC